jgi:hypothetical protein
MRGERGRVGVELDAIEKVHRGEQPLDHLLDRALEVLAERDRVAADLDQTLDLVVDQRPAPRQLAERTYDRLAAARVTGRRWRAGDDPRAQRGVGEDLLGEAVGGVEVLLVLRVGHAECGRDRVETECLFVGDEVGGGRRLHAQQIADGVVVLGVVEAMDADPVDVASGRGGVAGAASTARSGAGRRIIAARIAGARRVVRARHHEPGASGRGLDVAGAGRDRAGERERRGARSRERARRAPSTR